MKWFMNMKIAAKLISGFVLVAIVAAVVGVIGITNIKSIDKSDTQLYENMTVPISQIGDLSTAFQRTRVNIRDMVLTSDSEVTKSNVDKIAERHAEIDRALQAIDKTIISDEMRELYKDLVEKEAAYREQIAKLSVLATQDAHEEAMVLMSETGSVGTASREFQTSITNFVTAKLADAKLKADNNTSQANSASTFMIIVIIIGVIISLLLGVFLSNIISKPMMLLAAAADKLAVGDVDVNVKAKTKDEIGTLMSSFEKMVDNIKVQSEVAEKIAAGELGVEIIPKSDKDVLSKSLKFVVETLRKLVAEAEMLTKAAVEGKLDTRGNGDSFKGGYKQIVNGVNQTLDSVIGPLNVAAEYVDRISKGDIPPKITDVYYGDFNEIKNNLNNCIDAVNALVADAGMLSKAALEGKLDTRADATKHGGDFRKIVEGVNNTLDAIVQPLNIALNYISKMANGEDLEVLDNKFKGDYSVLIENLTKARNSLYTLLDESSKLTVAASKGELSYRADISRLKGGYAEIVNGVNQTLDSVIGPLNVAAEYVDRISQGDIPPKITDVYYGDFNEIKNNLNNCIDNISALVADANMLSIAAVEGKLDTRADATKHGGDYRKIVEGVNKTLDEVIRPIKEAGVVLKEMASGNLQLKVKGEYKGDNANIKNALNETIDSLSIYINEISEVLGEMANSNLDLVINTDYKGDFAQIKDALNLIISSFNEVFSDINNSSDQVASGSRQVSDGSQALAQGATEQASSVEELTASITQVAAQTKENAINANQANELALTAKKNAEQGNEHMNGMLGSMKEINESSSNISKIIKVIDDIAFQTNILALNAAVEAARAGQHGKGFAVVAEEVRNLAARSANAAKETTALIEGSIKKVEAGTQIANDTAKALVEIVGGVAKAATLVGDIASASNEQASAIAQINKGIDQVSRVVQTNSATAEESAAASEELSSQAELLKQMVSKFKLKRNTNSNRYAMGENETSRMVMESKRLRSQGYAEAAATSLSSSKKSRIALNDNEFGKY